MTYRAPTLGVLVALSLAVLSPEMSVGSGSYIRLSTPFSPHATIYRPECWVVESPAGLCDFTGSIGE
jgi:hypothetical protein